VDRAGHREQAMQVDVHPEHMERQTSDEQNGEGDGPNESNEQHGLEYVTEGD
jgi:hypothetical protein